MRDISEFEFWVTLVDQVTDICTWLQLTIYLYKLLYLGLKRMRPFSHECDK